MTRETLLLAGFGLAVQVHAQNLIPNGSFEEYWNPCSKGASYNFLDDWILTSCAFFPGLLAECDGDVPQSSLGYQEALDGGAFLMLITFTENIGPLSPGNNPLYYAHVLLTEPLVADQRYCLRLGVSLADSSSYRTTELNAFFWYGTTSRCASNDTLWDDSAQVTFDISEVDTSGWTILEKDFVATGGENSLTLGAFQFGNEIDTAFISSHDLLTGDKARYFVDDIRLVACAGVGLPEYTFPPSISPIGNLAADVLMVRNNARAAESYSIHALDGHLIRTGALLPGDNALDVGDLAEGVYVLRTQALEQRFVVMR